MPRHLAIRILHEAQIAQPEAIRGVVAARGGAPAAFLLNRAAVADGDALWATLWSHPEAEAVPRSSELRDGLLSSSDERRVGKECVSTGRSRWSTDPKKKN